MKKLLLLIGMLSAYLSLNAQQFAQIGTGTDVSPTTLYGPIYRFSATSTTRSIVNNMVFTQAELSAAGLTTGAVISSFQCYKVNNASSTPFTFKVFMANSSVAPPLATTTTWASILASHTPVYDNAAFVLTSDTGWYTFSLSTPFTYTGGSLEIATQIDYGTSAGTVVDNNVVWQYTTGFATSIIASVAATPAALSATTATYKHRPNIRIHYANAACVNPPVAGTALSGRSAVCPDDWFSLRLSGNTTGTGQTYQWQTSSDSIIWSDITGATLENHFTLQSATTQYYRCQVSCGGNTQSSAGVKVRATQPLAGNVIVDGTQSTSGNTFNNFQEVLDHLACAGISAPTSILFSPDTYTGNFVIPAFAGMGTHSLTLAPLTGNPTDVVFTNGGNNGNALSLTSLQNININALSFDNPVVPTAASSGVKLTSCTNISIAGCIFSGAAGATTSDNKTLDVTTSSNIMVSGNQFSKSYYGVSHTGPSTPNYDANNTYQGNVFNDIYLYGMYFTNQSDLLVDGNQVLSMDFNPSGGGIYLSRFRSSTVSNNKAVNINGIYGIYLGNPNRDGNNPNRVYNNVISGDFSNALPKGIYLTGSRSTSVTSPDTTDYIEVVNNSVDMRVNTSSASANGIVYITGGSTTTPAWNGIVLKNNSFKTDIQGGAPTFLVNMYISLNQTANVLSSSNNCWYYPSRDTMPFVQLTTTRLAANSFYTLASWQGYATGMEAASITTNPAYTSNLNLEPLGVTSLNNGGTPISYVTTDIAGITRNATTPDIGAYEVNIQPFNLIATGITSPLASAAPGSTHPVTLRFLNSGSTTITSATVSYQLDNNTIVSQPFAGNLALGDTATFTFTTQVTLPAAGIPVLKAWVSLPNGQNDADPANDSSTLILCYQIPAGTHTVGAPASTYPNISALMHVLNCSGIAGPVTFNFEVPGNYYEGQLTLISVPGASATNTITLNGQGDTISSAPNATTQGIVLLRGTSHVTLRNFVLKGLGNASGVVLTNAHNNHITNNTLLLDTNGTSATVGGIVVTGSNLNITTVAGANNNLIDSNYISGAYYGVRFNGEAANKNAGNIVRANLIHDFYIYGIYVLHGENTVIEFNDISRANRRTLSTFYGIALATGTAGTTVSKNKVHNSHDNAITSTTVCYALYSSGADGTATTPNIWTNNLVYNMSSLSGAHHGIYNSSSDFNKYYHNTIVLDHALSTSGDANGFYQTGSATDIDIKNNIFYINRSGTGAKHNLYFAVTSAPFSVISSNNNVLTMLSTGGTTNRTGYYKSVGFNTLADWQTADTSAYDQNSSSADPVFVSIPSDLKPTNGLVNDMGANLLTLVPTDFNGVARTAAPDPGVYEFTPPAIDGALTTLSIVSGGVEMPVEDGCIPSLNNQVRIQVTNAGADTLFSIPVAYKLNSNAVVNEVINTPLAPANSVVLTFATLANFTNGVDTLIAWAKAANDFDPTNDTIRVVANNFLASVLSVPFYTGFESGSLPGNACTEADTASKVEVLGTVGANNLAIRGNGSLVMTGSLTGAGWVTSTATNWATVNPAYNSSISYYVKADTVNRLSMRFKLRQLYRGSSLSTNFAVLVNDVPVAPVGYISPDFRPANAAASNDTLDLLYDLDQFVGDTLKITFFSNVRYDYTGSPLAGNIIDELNIFQPTDTRFDSLTAVVNACTPVARTISTAFESGLNITNVRLRYNVNSGALVTAPMTLASNYWTANIPAAAPRDTIRYFVETESNTGIFSYSDTLSYIDDYLDVDAGPDQTIASGGSAQLQGQIVGGAPGSSLKITEFIYYRNYTTGSAWLQTTWPAGFPSTVSDQYEITNLGFGTVNMAGKKVTLFENATNSWSITFPAGTTLGAGQTLLMISGPGVNDPVNNFFYFGAANDQITSGELSGLVLYDDDQTTILDVVAINQAVFHAAPASDWSGDLDGGSGSQVGVYRTSIVDNNTNTDWQYVNAVDTTSIGYLNPSFGGVIGIGGSFEWTTLAGTVVGTTAAITVNPTTTTSYVVSYTDGVCTTRDTVVVTVTLPAPDAGISRIVSPTPGSSISTPQTIVAVVKNYGQVPVTGFDVSYTITPSGVTRTNTILATIAPGDSLQHTFTDTWTPTTGGNYTICAYTLLTNDANRSNDTSCVAVISPVSVESLALIGSNLYPNPARDEVTISFSESVANAKVTIVDGVGRLVHTFTVEAGINEMKVDVSALSAGIYSYRLESDSKIAFGKFVINK